MTSRQATEVGVTLSAYSATTIDELLGFCEEFLRTASPVVLAELRTYLREQHPPADPAWFIDMLGFQHAHLTRARDTARHLRAVTNRPDGSDQ